MVIAFHKPYGVLCQFTPDQPGQKTFADFSFPPNTYPVGRLDMDSEGLILLSDEPGFNHRLLNPKTAHPRTYLAQVEGIPTSDALQTLRRGGLLIQGHRTLPCLADLVSPSPEIPERIPPIRSRLHIPTSWLQLTLTEGKNRQVRRMTAAVGFPTLRLMRIAIGDFSGQLLQPGEWKILSPQEIRQVWKKSPRS